MCQFDVLLSVEVDVFVFACCVCCGGLLCVVYRIDCCCIGRSLVLFIVFVVVGIVLVLCVFVFSGVFRLLCLGYIFVCLVCVVWCVCLLFVYMPRCV